MFDESLNSFEKMKHSHFDFYKAMRQIEMYKMRALGRKWTYSQDLPEVFRRLQEITVHNLKYAINYSRENHTLPNRHDKSEWVENLMVRVIVDMAFNHTLWGILLLDQSSVEINSTKINKIEMPAIFLPVECLECLAEIKNIPTRNIYGQNPRRSVTVFCSEKCRKNFSKGTGKIIRNGYINADKLNTLEEHEKLVRLKFYTLAYFIKKYQSTNYTPRYMLEPKYKAPLHCLEWLLASESKPLLQCNFISNSFKDLIRTSDSILPAVPTEDTPSNTLVIPDIQKHLLKPEEL